MSVVAVVLMVGLFFSANSKLASLNEGDQVTEKKTKANQTDTQKNKKAKLLKELPDVKSSDWELLLVNGKNPITKEPATLTKMKNDYQIDQRIYDSYYELEEAGTAAGYSLTVISSYRSIAQQQEVYDNGVNQHLAEGLDQQAAEAKTAEYITLPGTSEHHTGLALDVVDQNWYAQGNGLEEEFCETPAGKWVDQNVANYGFIIRYPKDKEAITGINYEPWHIRYVGKESAAYMVKHELALEEYLKLLEEAGK